MLHRLEDRLAPTVQPISVVDPGLIADSGAQSSTTSSRCVSPDGRYVAFQSDASNLVPGDTNKASDVFVRDTLLGTTTRVSTASDGTQGNNLSLDPSLAVAPDGTVYVAFSSGASNLVAGDTNNNLDVFVKNLTTGDVAVASKASDGTQGNDGSYGPSLAVAPDGTIYVAFYSFASTLVAGDPNGHLDDVFVKNMTTGDVASTGTQGQDYCINPSVAVAPDGTVFVAFLAGDTNGNYDVFVKNMTTGNVASAGPQGNNNASGPSLAVAPDGTVYVAFSSDASNLVAGDTNNTFDVFVMNLSTGDVALASTASDGTQGNDGSSGPSLAVAHDGTVYVGFTSYASNLVAGDTNNTSDVFVKNRATGDLTRVSTASDGTQGNYYSYGPSLAVGSDGTVSVGFTSGAGNLVAGDTNGQDDVFVKDLTTFATSLVSRRDPDLPSLLASGGTGPFSLSADGRYLAFQSGAPNLLPGDTNNASDVFVRDTMLGTTTRVSTASDGTQGNYYSYSPSVAVAPDGTVYVAFTSDASNLMAGDTNNTSDVFVKNLTTGDVARVSTASDGTQGNYYSFSPSVAVAPDGTVYVAFTSDASNLVAGDTNNTSDVFVKNLTTGDLARVSTARDGTQGDYYSYSPSVAVASDGTVYVAFYSPSNLVAGDTNNNPDVFVKNLATGDLARVSTARDGTQGNNGSLGPSLAVAPDGTVYVAFYSYASNLVTGDTNDASDVFVKNLTTGDVARVSTASDGTQGFGLYSFGPSVAVAPDGTVYVAFYSYASNLVAGDTNNTSDVFVKNLTTGDLARVSAASDGIQGNGYSSDPSVAVAPDGTVYVAFDSKASNFAPGDYNGAFDVFLFSQITTDVTIPEISNPGDQSGCEGDPITLPIIATDADGDSLTYSSSGLPAGLSIDPQTGVITGTIGPQAAQSSPYSVTVSASDGTNTGSATFTWTVNDVTTPAVTNPGDQTSDEGTAVTLAVTAGDADSDSLTYTATGLPAGLGIDSSTGVISGTVGPQAAQSSPYTVSVSASDGRNADSTTFTWTVNDVTTPVVTDPGPQTSKEGDAVSLAITASDSDSDPLTYSATGLPAGLSINATTGVISGTVGPQAAQSSPYSVTVSASDGTNTGSTAFAWTVNDVTTPVVTRPSNQTSNEGAAVTLSIVATDSDSDPLTYSASGLPAGLNINATTGVISGTVGPQAAQSSPYTVSVSASDGTNTGSAAFTWTINDVTTPVVTPPHHQTSKDGSTVALQIQATDADNDPLTYSDQNLPPGLSINSKTGLISGSINKGGKGAQKYNVQVTASDGQLSSTVSFTWTVTPAPGKAATAELARFLIADPLMSPLAASAPKALAATGPGSPGLGSQAATLPFTILTLTPANTGSTAGGHLVAPDTSGFTGELWGSQVDAFFASSFADLPREPAAWRM
jgi:hypothetical protein